MKKSFFSILLVGFAFSLAAANTPAPVDEAQPLRNLIREAAARKDKYVKLPPGIYHCDADQTGAHLGLRDLSDIEIDGTGVELICRQFLKPASAITLLNCRNVKLKGFTIDADPLCFTQGKIAAIAPNYSYYDLKLDPGYADIDFFIRGIGRPLNIFDPVTRNWKNGVADLYIGKMEKVGDRLWRLHLRSTKPQKLNIAVGNLGVLCGKGGCAVSARNSENLTYENITIYQSGVMAFHEHSGGGNTHIINCKVTRRPGTDRLISTNADGFHCKNMRKGPTVVNSTFQYMMDDGTNIHGMFGRVTAGSGTVWELIPRYENNLQPGDTVEFYDAKTFNTIGKAKVVSSEPMKKMSASEVKKYFGKFSSHGYVRRITFDAPIQAKPGDSFMNLNACGAGFAIRGCTYGPLRFRGLLIRTINGEISDSLFQATGSGAIHVESDFRNDAEGPYAQNLKITGNRFENIGSFPGWDKGCGIFICHFNWPEPQHPDLIRIHRDLEIVGNRFNNTANDAIHVEHAERVKVSENVIRNCGGRNTIAKYTPVPIRIKNSLDVKESNNRLENNGKK